ncbi:MAG: hypothetical protein ACRDO2_01025 [Nocardioidaceae bacterium]
MSSPIHVSVPAVPGTVGGSGTVTDPYHSVAEAIGEAQDGAVVHLHAGHYYESVTVRNSDHDVLVEPAGDGPVFIDSLLPEFLNPNGGWIPVPGPPRSFNGEYVWHQPFDLPPGITNEERFRVNSGAFYDLPRGHTRLIGYSHVRDFRSTDQLWPKNVPGPHDGIAVWRKDTNDTFVPEDDNAKIRHFPPLYMGPGVWFDQRKGHRTVHVRLSHTTNDVPGWDDYRGETDPNQLSLALSRDEGYALFLVDCQTSRSTGSNCGLATPTPSASTRAPTSPSTIAASGQPPTAPSC